MTQKANYIGGAWVEGAGTLENLNPADPRDLIGLYASADEAQMRQAVQAARAAGPGWERSTTQLRSDILFRAANEILARKEELGALVSREAGKTLAEGMGEVVRAGQIFQFFAGEAVRYGGENLPSVRPDIGVQISRHPVGVVSMITPWNFPIAIPAWKMAPALAFGNTVVLKPSEHTPGAAWELFAILERAGLPAGVANLVNGEGAAAGQALLDGVDAVSFTGSVATGRKIATGASERMIRVQLEMGGKNPLVVLDDADLDVAVECALNGAFFSAGQRCTASSRLIVADGIHDRFVQALTERMRKLVVGDPRTAGTQIGPVINDAQLRKILGYIELGQSEGATLAEGGKRADASSAGHFLRPTLFTQSSNDMRINREEIFGPVAAVIRVSGYDEALEVANDTAFGLSSGICTTSLKAANHFRLNVRSGLTMVNLPTAGLDYHVPFGGVKASSFGPREQGRYAVDFYTSTKTAYIGY
ncbi:Aldehyde dehydrogenase, thermostable [Achromobacter denitrificans]|uniref:aldehyde dehydrogenase family protein n=1 Tax=Achromobacter denitrificans TaxID=32002 RepID=UPI0007888ED8|nr:aldehyde dehydrogenase family protein [Achromobacter denitrificans]OLU04424.1 aldehyde dehydrogenase family protein [Achromobacter denitrificans]QKH41748.1 aldehyde dehydrogenase family protein [Achromobacter denitrificans]QKH51109.1 aldehyde dehydrogenase family protein [Achromobacter denitrificans]CAB3733534.1 Alpha-ketoglutaric semialdehyde dehydrogenase [Achromobacter denitrificans]SUU25134.1 Aldehyde dehydrogenase, thermostable [Achromobacter denitrificans]